MRTSDTIPVPVVSVPTLAGREQPERKTQTEILLGDKGSVVTQEDNMPWALWLGQEGNKAMVHQVPELVTRVTVGATRLLPWQPKLSCAANLPALSFLVPFHRESPSFPCPLRAEFSTELIRL